MLYDLHHIFANAIDPDIISRNLAATISDHLPHFSIICLAICKAINLISKKGNGSKFI